MENMDYTTEKCVDWLEIWTIDKTNGVDFN